MNKKENVAFITGINGQDGSFLSEYLLSLGYEVHGIVRRNSVPEHQESRVEHLDSNPNFHTHYGDLSDIGSLERLLKEIQPTEIFNLGAQSHVSISFKIPQYTSQTNAIGVLNILEAYRTNCPTAKFYQASSSEQFGNQVDTDGYQRLTTPMKPVSPYGNAKLFAYNMVRIYRESYGLHACNGILFNHESPLRRGANFVTSKIVRAACMIKLGLQEKLELGNLDSYRDWGFSGDYVKMMHKIVNYKNPEDWIIATGETHSVREFCEYAFNILDLDYKDYVVQNPKYMRPNELKYLKGEATKAKRLLGFKPEMTFKTLVETMVYERMKLLKLTL